MEILAKGVEGRLESKYVVIFKQGEILTPILMLPLFDAKALLKEMQEEIERLEK